MSTGKPRLVLAGLVLAALAVVMLFVSAASAQTVQDVEKFWGDYRAAKKDPSGFARKRDLVRNHKNIIFASMNFQIFEIAKSKVAENEEDVADRLSLLEDLARMYELVHRSKLAATPYEYAKGIDAEKAEYLKEANEGYVEFCKKHLAYQAKPDLGMREEIVGDGLTIIESLEAAGELYLIGDVCAYTAEYLIAKEDWVEAAKLLDRAKRSFAKFRRAEWENSVSLKLMKIERDHGIKLGAGGEGPSVTRKEAKVRAEPKPLGVVKTKYKKDKGPSAFESPSWVNFQDHMLWRPVEMEKDKAMNWPLGDGSLIKWEGGSKILLDVENTGKKLKELKAVSGTAKTSDLPIRYARSRGKYRVLLRALGNSEKFLGGDFNYSSSTAIYVRMARACHLEGTFKGQKFALIDDNVNGKYDDYGQDLIKIGKELPQPLSPIMEFGGELVSILRVKEDGSEIHFQTYVGDTGTLQVKWAGARGVKPVFLIVHCTRGEFNLTYFNMADGKPHKIPNGFYQFQRGLVAQGKGKKMKFVPVEQGRSDVFEVKENETTVINMGGPFQTNALITASPDDGLRIMGNNVRIYGAAKELYRCFYPDSFTPVVSVRVAGGRTVLNKKKLGRPDQQLANENGWGSMFFPRPVEFRGSLEKKYEVKIDIVGNKLIGKVKGAWIESELPAEGAGG